MSYWKRVYEKTEANPAKSTVGCLIAFALLMLIAIALLYLSGASLRFVTDYSN